jgi:pimeloyl-ACP methyl ester carboxylesterase
MRPGWAPRFEVPFLLQGESDVITLTSLAEECSEEVEAPTKGLALINDAGHFAAFTQPDRFLAELRTRMRPLASESSPFRDAADCGSPHASRSSRS